MEKGGSLLQPSCDGGGNRYSSFICVRKMSRSQTVDACCTCMVITYSKGKDQPGKAANPARGQLNREDGFFSLSPFAPENLVSRDGFGSPVPRQPGHLHTQAESGAYLRDSFRVPRRRPFIYFNV